MVTEGFGERQRGVETLAGSNDLWSHERLRSQGGGMSSPEGAASSNRYYAPGEDRAGKVRLLFSRIAGRYDLVNDLMSGGMHRRWKRRLAEAASPRPGEEALDICCGTGDVSRSLVGAAEGGRVKVTGLDF